MNNNTNNAPEDKPGANNLEPNANFIPNNASAIKAFESELTANVYERVLAMQQTGLKLPQNYNVGNALKLAFLTLADAKDKQGTYYLQICTKISVANSLLRMCIWGLNPGKNQCYFVPKGDTLVCMRSYEGTVMLAKRVGGVKEIVANVIYEADKFNFGFDLVTGRRVINQHDTALANIDENKIIGAYAVAEMNDGSYYVEVMNKKQLEAAWNMGDAYKSGNSKSHNNFMAQMAEKTVKYRAAKHFINTSDDADLYEDSNEELSGEDAVIKTIRTEANKEVLSLQVNETAPLVTEPIVQPQVEKVEIKIQPEQTQETNPHKPKF